MMNLKRPILIILVIVLGLIMLYNYLFTPLFAQPNSRMRMGMGMGMHGYMYNNQTTFFDFKWLILIIGIVLVWLFFALIHVEPKEERCMNCRTVVENERWKVCPRCGTAIQHKRGVSP